jgi:hypothetical protein
MLTSARQTLCSSVAHVAPYKEVLHVATATTEMGRSNCYKVLYKRYMLQGSTWHERASIYCEIASLLSARQHGGCKHILPRFKPDQDGDDDAESLMAWAQLALTWPAAVAANGTPSVPVTVITRKCRTIYIVEITCVFVFSAPDIPTPKLVWEEHGKIGARSRQIVETLHDDGACRPRGVCRTGGYAIRDTSPDASGSHYAYQRF